MKLGLALPHYDFSFPDRSPVTMARVLDYARRAEALGFDSVWVSDHLFLDLGRYGGPPVRQNTPEALAMLAGIAAVTSRVRLGPLVLCASFRHAALLASQARSLHDLSGGRFELGLGAGWYEAEFAAAGLPFGTTGERIARLSTVAGQLDARIPEPVTTWIGGKGGPKLARVIAEQADGWNVCWRMNPAEYRKRLDTLAQACSRAGRDPASVRRSVGLYTLLGTDDADLAARYRRLQEWTPGDALSTDLDAFAVDGLVGTPERCAAIVKEFEALGVEELIVSVASLPFSVYDDEQLELVAGALGPLVR